MALSAFFATLDSTAHADTPHRDIVAYRPSSGVWYVRPAGATAYPTHETSYQWGLPGDIPVPGDYDGDTYTDLAVFRPSTGEWLIETSSHGYWPNGYLVFQWGLSGDIPLAGDFDGDHITDLTVYRPSDGNWLTRYSSMGYSIGGAGVHNWGMSGDQPVVGDFDGDGRADLTTFRPSTGEWSIWFSSQGFVYAGWAIYQWGLSGDIPLSGDFDGDHITDLTVYCPSNGNWLTRYSSMGYSIGGAGVHNWGMSGDQPVVGDFDADGRADLTTYRPSTGEWSIWYSAQGFVYAGWAIYQWGLSGDVPLVPPQRARTTRGWVDNPAPDSTVWAPQWFMSGWAADFGNASGPGLDFVQVYALGGPQNTSTFLGQSSLGLARPDVADIYGNQFVNSGWSLDNLSNLLPGFYMIVPVVRTTNTQEWFALSVFPLHATAIATPTFSHASGTYTGSLAVGVSTLTPGATLRYTADGTEPSASSPVYGAPLLISSTTTLKAKAFASGSVPSSTAVATFVWPAATGRWFLSGSDCQFDAGSTAHDECDPNNGPGRWKMVGPSCVWAPYDWGFDQCTTPSGWKTVSFIVRDLGTSNGLCGALVQLSVDSGNGSTRTTNCNGLASFAVQLGLFNYSVSAAGYSSDTGSLTLSGNLTVYQSLVKLSSITGGEETGTDILTDPADAPTEFIGVPDLPNPYPNGLVPVLNPLDNDGVYNFQLKQKRKFYLQVLNINREPIAGLRLDITWNIKPSGEHTHSSVGVYSNTFFKEDLGGVCYTNGGPYDNACEVNITATDISSDFEIQARTSQGFGVSFKGRSGMHQEQGGFTDRLQNYQAGKDWHFYGDKPVHPGGNQWCETDFCTGLNTLFTEYAQRYSLPVWFNDISLKRGGRYDTDWDKGRPWRDPHIFHMTGLDADIRSEGVGAIPYDEDTRKWIIKRGFELFHHLPLFESSPRHLHVYGWPVR